MTYLIRELEERIIKDGDLTLPEIVEFMELSYMAGRLRSLAAVSNEDCEEVRKNILKEMMRIRYENPYE
jgi:hypothetical protein